jgi:hypothetical protein
MTDTPLCLLVGRAVANAKRFARGGERPQSAIREAYDVLSCLILEETRGPLWQATQQLCLGTMGAASGDGAGKLDALCDTVIREQVRVTPSRKVSDLHAERFHREGRSE